MPESDEAPSRSERLWRWLVGPPRDLRERGLFHRIALIPVLAWVGLGADGLSSSAYGPAEAFVTLGEHTYLAAVLVVMMATTVLVISAGYSRIIEQFPQGGGGYVVATALLGQRWGVVSGCALVIDYILTVTISIAAAGEALYSFVPLEHHYLKLPTDFAFILLLVLLNVRGLRESILVLTPVFLVFAVTHFIAIVGGVVGHLGEVGSTAREVSSGFQSGMTTLGLGGMLLLLLHAYSLGGGTYTGIEAVSNGLSALREPRVENGKRTMLYMAVSLAFTASGLLLLYLLWDVSPEQGRTLNATLLDRLTESIPGGSAFALVTLLSESALLVVAAQAGFADGPRVLASMAVDSWVPRRFAALSERLTMQNGIVLLGAASITALLYTHGDVRQIVVLYAINVFITFSLSLAGMLRHSLRAPASPAGRNGGRALFGFGTVMCVLILGVTIFEKFFEGGWLTLLVTGGFVALCFWVKRHYRLVVAKLNELYRELEKLPQHVQGVAPDVDPKQPTAAVLVAGYGGLGIHTLMNLIRVFPGYFKNVVFLSVGVIDSGEFKGEGAVEAVRNRTQRALDKYVDLARRLPLPAASRMAIGTDVVEEAESLCLSVAREFPRITFFAGKVIFQRERWYQRLLHNETAIALQARLHWAGHTMVILPARVR